MNSDIQFSLPSNLFHLKQIAQRCDGNISYAAGTTDLVLSLPKYSPDILVDITQIKELNFINVGESSIKIGAATTFATLSNHQKLQRHMPAITQAAGQVGSMQIRNRATIGGNITSAVPGGDLLPVLQCIDSYITILRSDGSSTKHRFEDVITGLGQTNLGNGDLITEIEVPYDAKQNTISAFAKIGPRDTLTIARLNAAVLADYAPSERRVETISIVLGAIGPKPVKLHEAERSLSDRIVNKEFANDLLDHFALTLDTAIAGRSSYSYKKCALKGLADQILRGLFGAHGKGLLN